MYDSDIVLRWLAGRRRQKILKQEFPPAWTAIIERNVAGIDLLDDDEKKRLRELVQVFLAEKHFEGCGGLEVTDEMRVTIAGTGCLMLLGRDHDLFSEVETVLIYPSTVIARDLGRSVFDTSGRVVNEGKAILGQAVKGGAMILAWDSALQGAKDGRDGNNVVIHELAHKIDFIDGSADGTPQLETAAQRQQWAAAFQPAFLAHKARAAKGKKSFLDDYAITNEAEYFAVASETFFEKPRAFAKQLPEVYKALAGFYNIDFAARTPKESPKPAAKGAKKQTDQKPARKGAPAPAVPAPVFRKTAAMAVVALPADLDAPAPRNAGAAASRGKSSAALVVPPAAPAPVPAAANTKATRGKSSAAIVVPPVDTKQPRGKSSAAIVLPPVDAKQPRPRSSAAIVVPQEAIAKATRGKSSAAIVVPPVDAKQPRGKSSAAIVVPQEAIAKATRGKSSAAIAVPPVDATPTKGKSSAAIVVPQEAIAKATRGKSAVAIAAPPVDATPTKGKSSAAIVVPQEAIAKATRGKSSAAIVLPPVDDKPRPKSSAAIVVPQEAIAKATRGKSSAAIILPPVDETPTRRGKAR